MGIVCVENDGSTTQLRQDTGKDPRIEARLPRDRPDPYLVGFQPAGQLGIFAGDNHLMDAQPFELPGQ
jgi:hypothetical protein